MLQALRGRWSSALALLIAVATAWMFTVSRPTSPPPGSAMEIVCTPEIPVTPGIFKQQDSSDPPPPRGAAMATHQCCTLFQRTTQAGATPSLAAHQEIRAAPIRSGYPRGPPTRA